MKLFSTFLKVFHAGLLRSSEESQVHSMGTGQSLTPVICRILPVLRLYSSWLTKSSALANSDFVRNELKADFWASLAEALSMITSTFSTDQLPNVDHLLEEDEETVKFLPLCSSEDNNFWYLDGSVRARWSEKNEQKRDLDREMLFRIKDFLVVGLTLTVDSVSEFRP